MLESAIRGTGLMRRRRFVVGVGVLLVLAAMIALALGMPGEIKAAVARGLALLRSAGPVMFFAGMAVLPALGFPLAPFTLTAGPAFGPTIGPTQTALCAVAAVAVNVTLSYTAARWWLRRPVERLLAWLGYCVPGVPREAAWHLAFVVRLLPGPPFWVQSYALGLIQLPFLAYLTASVVVPAVYVVAVVFGGDALWRGERTTALLAFALVGLLACAVGLIRKLRPANRKATVRVDRDFRGDRSVPRE